MLFVSVNKNQPTQLFRAICFASKFVLVKFLPTTQKFSQPGLNSSPPKDNKTDLQPGSQPVVCGTTPLVGLKIVEGKFTGLTLIVYPSKH